MVSRSTRTTASRTADRPEVLRAVPVIERLERVSRPGLRIYKSRNDLPEVMNGLAWRSCRRHAA